MPLSFQFASAAVEADSRRPEVPSVRLNAEGVFEVVCGKVVSPPVVLSLVPPHAPRPYRKEDAGQKLYSAVLWQVVYEDGTGVEACRHCPSGHMLSFKRRPLRLNGAVHGHPVGHFFPADWSEVRPSPPTPVAAGGLSDMEEANNVDLARPLDKDTTALLERKLTTDVTINSTGEEVHPVVAYGSIGPTARQVFNLALGCHTFFHHGRKFMLRVQYVAMTAQGEIVQLECGISPEIIVVSKFRGPTPPMPNQVAQTAMAGHPYPGYGHVPFNSRSRWPGEDTAAYPNSRPYHYSEPHYAGAPAARYGALHTRRDAAMLGHQWHHNSEHSDTTPSASASSHGGATSTDESQSDTVNRLEFQAHPGYHHMMAGGADPRTVSPPNNNYPNAAISPSAGARKRPHSPYHVDEILDPTFSRLPEQQRFRGSSNDEMMPDVGSPAWRSGHGSDNIAEILRRNASDPSSVGNTAGANNMATPMDTTRTHTSTEENVAAYDAARQQLQQQEQQQQQPASTTGGVSAAATRTRGASGNVNMLEFFRPASGASQSSGGTGSLARSSRTASSHGSKSHTFPADCFINIGPAALAQMTRRRSPETESSEDSDSRKGMGIPSSSQVLNECPVLYSATAKRNPSSETPFSTREIQGADQPFVLAVYFDARSPNVRTLATRVCRPTRGEYRARKVEVAVDVAVPDIFELHGSLAAQKVDGSGVAVRSKVRLHTLGSAANVGLLGCVSEHIFVERDCMELHFYAEGAGSSGSASGGSGVGSGDENENDAQGGNSGGSGGAGTSGGHGHSPTDEVAVIICYSWQMCSRCGLRNLHLARTNGMEFGIKVPTLPPLLGGSPARSDERMGAAGKHADMLRQALEVSDEAEDDSQPQFRSDMLMQMLDDRFGV